MLLSRSENMIKSLLSLGLVLVIGAIFFERFGKPKKNETKQVSLPLTQVSPENEEWVLYSDFEKVGDNVLEFYGYMRTSQLQKNIDYINSVNA